MMKEEFEAIIGYEVTESGYRNVIEPMYMATNLSKQEFAKVVNAKQFKVEKSQERIDFENELKSKIEEARESIKYCESEIARYEYLLDGETEQQWIDSYKYSIECNKKWIKEYKRDIQGMRFVLG